MSTQPASSGRCWRQVPASTPNTTPADVAASPAAAVFHDVALVGRVRCWKGRRPWHDGREHAEAPGGDRRASGSGSNRDKMW